MDRRRLRTLPAAIAVVLLAAPALSAASASATGTSRIPKPESVIGWTPCTDYKLATYEQIADYYRKLDAASDRMKLMEIGKTSEGRPQLMAVVSSEENLKDKNLKRYKDISVRLSQGDKLSDSVARGLAKEGKTIAWVDFGIHSTEVAGHQTAPQFAYDLVTSETTEAREVRDNVVTLLVPNVNPDGGTKVANWYRQNLGGAYQDAGYPELYQKYAGHDNNRDWYMFNLQETQNVGRQLFHEWLPQMMHNVHQTAVFPGRISIPPYEDPMNPNINPQVVRGVNLIGEAMGQRLDREGKVGALARQSYDIWWNGGARTAPYYHNQIGILTETAHASATPRVYDPKDFPATFADGTSTTQPSVFYPSPWKGGEWHLSQSCAYIVSASWAMLRQASDDREGWLYGAYQMARDGARDGGNTTYVIPADQADFPTATKLVDKLRWNNIQVERAVQSFTVGSRTYPAGSYVVREAQPYRAAVLDLLNAQVYPDRRLYPGGPLEPPYDITGYTLSFQMGVTVDKLDQAVRARTASVDWPKVPEGTVAGAPRHSYALDPRVNDSATAVNALLAAGEQVWRAGGEVTTRTGKLPAGAFLVKAGASTGGRVTGLAKQLGLSIAAVDTAPTGLAALKAPRIGLYDGFNNYDEGWTRYVLDQFKFGYQKLTNTAVRAGDLRSSFDTIVLPDATYNSMRNGRAAGSLPDSYTGGMTPAGVANLKAFVEAGGTIVTLNRAAQLPIQAFGVPVKDVSAGVEETEYNIPGSVLNLGTDASDPVAAGFAPATAAFVSDSPIFQVNEGASGVSVAATWPETKLLKSGFLLGEDLIGGQPAVVTSKVGKGEVVMIGFKAQHRAQSHGTYRFLFNAMYLGGQD
ncbi:peptidase [Asanoa ishikariensis]|uniref:Murein tripeptide amidase MpaA n=1 Tax=Asanoa ishikariensis TaxID=137265 RepID=A0A1H3NQQ0_9ACTN|nr:M14 metallopeptidase family protein [Asanoa ishikariensis]GIF68448.1 peptidase [Asanoa ishikariensis]SDY91010.1 Murein tripeptide amidase MpaA [Asanoa ishikariensis]